MARVDDVIHDVTVLNVWHVRLLADLDRRVGFEGRAAESFRGAWRRVLGLLGLKFLGFVNTRPFKTPVWSVL